MFRNLKVSFQWPHPRKHPPRLVRHGVQVFRRWHSGRARAPRGRLHGEHAQRSDQWGQRYSRYFPFSQISKLPQLFIEEFQKFKLFIFCFQVAASAVSSTLTKCPAISTFQRTRPKSSRKNLTWAISSRSSRLATQWRALSCLLTSSRCR